MCACTYFRTAKLLRRCAQLLRLPPPVAITALTYLHRYQQVRKEDQVDQIIVAACIYIATKVEEAHIRTNELLNVVHYAVGRDSQEGTEPGVLVGDQYSVEKQRLVHAEQVVLRTISFDLAVVQPHKYLLNFCRTLEFSQSVAQLSAFLLNDSLIYTTLCITASAPHIAAGALLLAILLLEPSEEFGSGLRSETGWVEVIGLRRSDVERVANTLLTTLKNGSLQNNGAGT